MSKAKEPYQKLFDSMYKEHDLILLRNDIHEIETIVLEAYKDKIRKMINDIGIKVEYAIILEDKEKVRHYMKQVSVLRQVLEL